jgi:hypothetical protein
MHWFITYFLHYDTVPTYRGKYMSNCVILTSGIFFNNDYSHSKLPAAARTPRYLALTPLEHEWNFRVPSMSILSRRKSSDGEIPRKKKVCQIFHTFIILRQARGYNPSSYTSQRQVDFQITLFFSNRQFIYSKYVLYCVVQIGSTLCSLDSNRSPENSSFT